MTYTIAVCTVKTADDGQRDCPKHVEFYSKNKFEKLVHLVGFIIRIYHDARSPERQIIALYNNVDVSGQRCNKMYSGVIINMLRGFVLNLCNLVTAWY